MAEVGDTAVGVAKVGNGRAAGTLVARNEPRRRPTVHPSNFTLQNHRSKEKTMSDQENRKLQHTDEQWPGSDQKPGNQPNPPVQQKQENPSGQPKSPRSEQEKHDQEKKKQA